MNWSFFGSGETLGEIAQLRDQMNVLLSSGPTSSATPVPTGSSKSVPNIGGQPAAGTPYRRQMHIRTP